MNLIDLALVIPNVLSDDDCKKLIKEYEQKKILVAYEESFNATDHKIYNSSGKIIFLKQTSPNFSLLKTTTKLVIEKYISYLESKQSFYTEKLKELLLYAHAFRMIKYENNLKIHPHVDGWALAHASITLNLNEDYEGGDFIFFKGKNKIKLKKGDALIFPTDCYWVHEISPVTRGSRYCMNTFIRSVPNDYYDEVNAHIDNIRHTMEKIESTESIRL
jgi:hypothetical protein